jgi:hypothetical protein
MRKFSLVALVLLFCGTFAVAQESKGEFYAGWSFLHFDCGSGCPDSSVPAGFDLGGAYHFSRNLSAVADFDYHHKDLSDSLSTSGRALGLHFGPRVRMPMGKVTPFVHALFGFTDLSFDNSQGNFTDKAFSTKLGGGLDVSASRHFGIRLGEFNYYLTKFDGTNSPVAPALNGQAHQNNFTYSAGILIR